MLVRSYLRLIHRHRMRNSIQSAALENRFPFLCKVLYIPEADPTDSPHAPSNKMSWFLRSPLMPRVGDVIPYGQYFFSVTSVILEDCCTGESISKLDRQAKRVAEKEGSPKRHALIWVRFWGVQSV